MTDRLALVRANVANIGSARNKDDPSVRCYNNDAYADLVWLLADRDRLAAECELLKHAITDNIFLKQQVTNLLIERDRLAAECKALSDQCQDVRAQRDKAQAELSAARADAERYRWLRDAKLNRDNVVPLVDLWLFSRPTASAKAIDSAIDEDRAAPSAGGDQS